MRYIMIANSKSEYAYNLPWHHDSACYNFRIPTETLSYEQIKDISDPESIETLVIVEPLDNYDFIRGMVNLRYLYIYNDGELQDISFIEDLTKLFQIYIYKSQIKSLQSLTALMEKQKAILENTDELMYRILQSQKTVAINSCCELDCNVFYDTDIDLKAGYDEVIINGFYLPKNAKKRLALKKEA